MTKTNVRNTAGPAKILKRLRQATIERNKLSRKVICRLAWWGHKFPSFWASFSSSRPARTVKCRWCTAAVPSSNSGTSPEDNADKEKRLFPCHQLPNLTNFLTSFDNTMSRYTTKMIENVELPKKAQVYVPIDPILIIYHLANLKLVDDTGCIRKRAAMWKFPYLIITCWHWPWKVACRQQLALHPLSPPLLDRANKVEEASSAKP